MPYLSKNSLAKSKLSCPRGLRLKLGTRLLHATTGVLVRLIAGVARAFNLPPSAMEESLNRFNVRSGMRLSAGRLRQLYSLDPTKGSGR